MEEEIIKGTERKIGKTYLQKKWFNPKMEKKNLRKSEDFIKKTI